MASSIFNASVSITGTEPQFYKKVKDYILSLPNYTYKHQSTDSNYRVIVMVHHTKDFNDFYSFSTMEVSK